MSASFCSSSKSKKRVRSCASSTETVSFAATNCAREPPDPEAARLVLGSPRVTPVGRFSDEPGLDDPREKVEPTRPCQHGGSATHGGEREAARAAKIARIGAQIARDAGQFEDNTCVSPGWVWGRPCQQRRVGVHPWRLILFSRRLVPLQHWPLPTPPEAGEWHARPP